MSRFFGPPTQLGVVVPNLEQAIAYWTASVGAGPFFVIDDVPHLSFAIGSEPAPLPKVRLAMGNWGEMQLELVEPMGDSDATWHKYLRERGGGIHHVSVWTDDYDRMIADALANGMEIEAAGDLASGVRYTYFRSPGPADALVEVSSLTPDSAAFYKLVRDAAIGWDGSDPVRKIG